MSRPRKIPYTADQQFLFGLLLVELVKQARKTRASTSTFALPPPPPPSPGPDPEKLALYQQVAALEAEVARLEAICAKRRDVETPTRLGTRSAGLVKRRLEFCEGLDVDGKSKVANPILTGVQIKLPEWTRLKAVLCPEHFAIAEQEQPITPQPQCRLWPDGQVVARSTLPDDWVLITPQAGNGALAPRTVEGKAAPLPWAVPERGPNAPSREQRRELAGISNPRLQAKEYYSPGEHPRRYEEMGQDGAVVVTEELGRAAGRVVRAG